MSSSPAKPNPGAGGNHQQNQNNNQQQQSHPLGGLFPMNPTPASSSPPQLPNPAAPGSGASPFLAGGAAAAATAIKQPDPLGASGQAKPQGQLAAMLLRNRPDLDGFGGAAAVNKDIARSSSAPPTQAMNARTLLQSLENVDDMMDPRADPEYAAFFYSNSRLDPRLPPPIYAPGQSWQVWSNNNNNNNNGNGGGPVAAGGYNNTQMVNPNQMFMSGAGTAGMHGGVDLNRTWMSPDIRGQPAPGAAEMYADANYRGKQPIGPGHHSPPTSPSKRKNLVDMIQQDFPRTPSPVFAAQQLRQQQQQRQSLELKDDGQRVSDPKIPDPSIINPSDLRSMTRTPPPNGYPVNISPPPRASSTPPTDMVARMRDSVREGSPLVATQERPMSSDDQLLSQFQRFNMSATQMDGRPARQSNGYFYDPAAAAGGYGSPSFAQDAFANPMAGRTSPSTWNRGMPPQQPIYVRPGDQYTTASLPLDLKPNAAGYYVIPADQMRQPNGFYPQQAPPPQGYYVQPHLQMQPTGMMGVRPPHQPMAKKDMRASAADGSQVIRSAVLEEFRNNKSRRYELLDIAGHVVEFSTDQYGSRFIQQKLEVSSPDEKQLVFDEILPNALKLMTDVFGNYVVQKFFEYGSAAQKSQLVSQIQGNVLTLSLQMYGCRVIQKALEYLPLEQQKAIVAELSGHILQCVKDQNGNHVIQKAIERIPSDEIDFMISAFATQVYDLATHPYGCRVMQRVFEHCPETVTHPLLEELRSYTPTLVQDQYGNYVIQHILDKGRPEDKVNVIQQVKGQVLQMSKHKFASNVVEKCIISCNTQDRQGFIDEIIQTRSDGTTPLVQMMKDQYANYVIQKLLEISDPQQRDMLIAKIRPHFSSLRKFTYGKHIIAKIEKLTGGQAAAF